jgi:hypothetical protein
MHITRTKVALAVGVLLASAAASTSASASPARPDHGCTPSWQMVDTPPKRQNISELSGVEALSSKDVRIAGFEGVTGQSRLTRWDGRAITDTTQIPAMSVLPMGTSGPSYSSASEGWTFTSTGRVQTVQRWHDGRWAMMPLPVAPDPVHTTLYLSDVDPLSATDAWAVGGTYQAGAEIVGNTIPLGALVEHWDGSSWQIVPNPAADAPDTVLSAVAARSATDIWAVGYQAVGSGYGTFTEHYDGTSWTVVASPEGTGRSSFRDVSVGADGAVYAVGSQLLAGSATDAAPLAARWAGDGWQVMDLPDLGNGRMNKVYAANASSVWVIVEVPDGAHTFAHWDGSTWAMVEAPGPKGLGLRYYYAAIDGTGPNDVWAVGSVTDNSVVDLVDPQVSHLSCGRK